jgi:hypothetical protein
MNRPDPIRLGGVRPLTQPGLSSAGPELLVGMISPFQEAKTDGGIAGRSLAPQMLHPFECARSPRQQLGT